MRRRTGQQPGRKSASRPAVKPQFNRGSNAGFFLPSVYIGFRLFVLLGRRGDVFPILWRVRGRLVFLGEQFCWYPVLPDLAPPLRRALRPDAPVVFSGFVFDRYHSGWTNLYSCLTCRVQNPDILRAGRVGAYSGVAGWGRAGMFANKTVRLGNNIYSHSPKHRRHVVSTSSQKHEQAKSYVNRWRNKARGRQPFHPRFITGLSAKREALFVAGCRPVKRRLFIFVNPFHARHVREPQCASTG